MRLGRGVRLCRTYAVYVGDAEDELLAKCAEPTADPGDRWGL